VVSVTDPYGRNLGFLDRPKLLPVLLNSISPTKEARYCVNTTVSFKFRLIRVLMRPGFDSRHYQKKILVGLEWGPLSLVSTTEELLGKVAAPV
jgi:hypothetical protein